jgi:hypothetical protein
VSNQADIRDIQILGDLKIAFGRFGEDVLQILAALEKQFEEIQEQLKERQEHWQRQVDAAQEEVYTARRSLNECESQPDDEEGNSPDCSYEAERVSDAEKDLATYEENLETVKQWRHRIESQIADFQNDMHRLSNLASSRTSSVQSFLTNKIEILDRYVGGISSAVGTVGLQGRSGNDKILYPDLWDKAHGYQLLFVAMISGKTRQTHRRSANRLLADKLEHDAIWAAKFNERFGIDVLKYMKSGRSLLNPPNVVWHHQVNFPEMVQLIRKAEHVDPSLQDILHPGGVGGFSKNYGQ